jgi:hypothetical protein
MDAVVKRNGLDRPEAKLMKKCFKLALHKIASSDRKACSVRLVREARFISVNATNHLVVRVPAWSDRRERFEEDMILIWPKDVRPSIMKPAEFRRLSAGSFKLIPCFNLLLTWDQCLDLSKRDWMAFGKACRLALAAKARRWASNVLLD